MFKDNRLVNRQTWSWLPGIAGAQFLKLRAVIETMAQKLPNHYQNTCRPGGVSNAELLQKKLVQFREFLPIQGFVTGTHECTWKFRTPIYPNISKESHQRCKKDLTRNFRTQQIGAQIVQSNRQKSLQQMNTNCFRERLTQHSTSLPSSAL